MVSHSSLTWRRLIRTEAQGESRGWAGPGLVITPFYRPAGPSKIPRMPRIPQSQMLTRGPGEQGGVNVTPQALRPPVRGFGRKTPENAGTRPWLLSISSGDERPTRPSCPGRGVEPPTCALGNESRFWKRRNASGKAKTLGTCVHPCPQVQLPSKWFLRSLWFLFDTF